MHHHKTLGSRVGLSQQQLDAVANHEDSAAFDGLQRAVLTFAEQLTNEAAADKEVAKKLAESLSPGHLVKLAATVGLANWTNRFNHAFGVELP